MQGMKNVRILVVFLLLLQIVMVGNMALADWRDRFGPPRDAALSEIIKNPEMWLDVPVRLHLRFSKFAQIYNPFFTQFTQDQYINFFAWDVQIPIWDKEGFNNVYPYFYVIKDNPELKSFLKLQTFDTISVYGKVTSIFNNRPYFRISWVCRLNGNLNIYNLRLLHNGMAAFKQRDFQKAITTFEKIFLTDPPNDIKAMLHKIIAKIYIYERKSYTEALMELDKIKEIVPQDEELNTLYYLCNKYMALGTDQIPTPNDIGPDESAEIPKKEEDKPKITDTSKKKEDTKSPTK